MAEIVRLPAFLRLDPLLGWLLAPQSAAVSEDPESGRLELAATGMRLSPLTDPGGSFGGLTLPTGVVVAPDGRILVADPTGAAILQHPHQGLYGPDGGTAPGFAPLWPGNLVAQPATGDCRWPQPAIRPGPHQLIRPRGLAFSADGDLAVTDAGDQIIPARLLIYSWPDAAVRLARELPGRPWDIVTGPDQHLYYADDSGEVVQLDRQWRPVTAPDWRGGKGVLNQPHHLAFAQDGSLLVIDTDPVSGLGRLVRLDGLGRATVLLEADYRAIWQSRLPAPLTRVGTTIFAPVTGCVGPVPALKNVAVSRQGRLGQGPQLLYLRQEARLNRKGRIITSALDSGITGFGWHRLVLDADLPATTAIDVQTLTSDIALEDSRVALVAPESWSHRIVLHPGQLPELLIQSPPGRYLWLQLDLIGDGTTSPRIRAIDLSGPRQSSLRLLPEPFHEDPVSRDFIDRFLSYFDTVFAETEARVVRFPATLTAHSAPEGAFLAWLASWFDIRFLAQWPDATRRAFVARADEISRKRGTIAGIKAVLQLHLGVQAPLPAVIENFRLRNYAARRSDAGAALPDGRLRLGGLEITTAGNRSDLAHRFVLILPEALVPKPQDRATLTDLVDAIRPAHTGWGLIVVPQGVRIGCQSSLGIDMVLGGVPAALLGEMSLHQNARLHAPPHPPPRIGQAVLRAP